MEIYFVILGVCFFAALIGRKSKSWGFYACIFIILAFLGAFRDVSVGADTYGSYLSNWNAITMDMSTWGVASEMETGFCFIMAFFKTFIDDNYYFFYGSLFFITLTGFSVVIRHYCVSPLLGIAFLVCFLYYTTAYNAIRQSFALSCVFPLIALIDKKGNKYLVYYIGYTLLLTFLFHRTMIVFLLLPLIYKKAILSQWFYGRKGVILLFLSFLAVFATKRLLSYAPEISVLLSIMGNRYSEYMTNYLDVDDVTISPWSSFLKTSIAMLIAFIYKRDKMNDIFYLGLIVGVILQNVLGAFSALFMRVGYNLLFFQVILFANLWYKKEYQLIYILRLSIIVFGLITFSNAITKNFGDIVPYVNILF